MTPRFSQTRRMMAAAACAALWTGVCLAQGTGTATRTMPSAMVSLETYRVEIAINANDPPTSPVAIAVEENYPDGWTVSNISDGGVDVGTDVRFGLFEGAEARDRVVSYDIAPPLGISGNVNFTGEVSFDGNSPTILGTTVVTVGVPTSLLATTIDAWPGQGSAVVQWSSAPYPTLAGYRVRRDGALLHAGLITSSTLAFTDSGYPSGAGASYTIEAVSFANAVLATRTTTVLPIGLDFPAGPDEVFQGTFAAVDYSLTNAGGAASDVDLNLFLVNPLSATTTPFHLSNRTIPAAGATSGTAVLGIDRLANVQRDLELVAEQLLPQEHATVRFHRIRTVTVNAPGRQLDLFAGGLIRGITADIRLQILNAGSAPMQVVTDRDSGNSDVAVKLFDTDGHLLAQSYLEQSAPVGGTQLGNAKSFISIAPGESFLSEPISLLIPLDAQTNVVLQGAVAVFYNAIDSASQVSVPGTDIAQSAVLTSPPYLAQAEAEFNAYAAGSPVQITGTAYDPNTLELKPNVPVKVGVSVKGFDRFYSATTNESGSFELTFQPFTTEAGNYALWAVHPDVVDRPAQDTFVMSGLRFQERQMNVTVPRNATFSFDVALKNLGEDNQIPTSVVFDSTVTMEGVTARVDAFPASIPGGQSRAVRVTLETSSSPADFGLLELRAEGNNGCSDATVLNVSTYIGGPVLSAAPGYVESSVKTDEVVVAATRVTNIGTEPLTGARVIAPALDWVALVIDSDIGTIAPGETREVPLSLLPGAGVAGGIYTEPLRIESDNHAPFHVFFSMRVITSDAGDLLVRAGDLLVTEVPIEGLQVIVQESSSSPGGGSTGSVPGGGAPERSLNQTEPLRLVGKTDANGAVLFTGLPPGDYKYSVSGFDYQSASGTTAVERGTTAEVHELMRRNFVNVFFSVTPITIEDRYQITLETTFRTEVLAPVLVIDPPQLEIVPVAGTTINNVALISNKGLIAIQDLRFPTVQTADFRVEPLITELGDLPARTQIQVPFRIVTPYPEDDGQTGKFFITGGKTIETAQIKDIFLIVCDVFEKCKFDPEICLYGHADLCEGNAQIIGCIRLSVLCKIIPLIPMSLGDLAALLLPEGPLAECAKESLESGGMPGTGCLCEIIGAASGDAGAAPCCKAITGLGLKDMYDCMCKLTKCDCPSLPLEGRYFFQGQGGGEGGGVTIDPPCD